jgi:sialidase-1
MFNIQKFTVDRDDNFYEGWPDLTVTSSGKMICVFSECSFHYPRENARIMYKHSADRGRTWSEKKPLSPSFKFREHFNCPRISVLNDGRIAVVCDRVIGEEGDRAEIWIWLSCDDGVTWSEPTVCPFCGIVPDKLKQLKNGRILLTAHFGNDETGKATEYLWYSDDDMKTWSSRITVASDPRYNLCEASVLECSDGTLVAFMRENSFKGYDCFKTISYDNGESWSEVYNANLPGCHRPVSGILPDGSVMISYRFFPGGGRSMAYTTQNTMIAFTDEASAKEPCRDKQNYRIIPLDYDRSPKADTGYTGFVAYPDGEIYMVNYIVDDAPKAQIRGYNFRKDNFLITSSVSEI